MRSFVALTWCTVVVAAVISVITSDGRTIVVRPRGACHRSRREPHPVIHSTHAFPPIGRDAATLGWVVAGDATRVRSDHQLDSRRLSRASVLHAGGLCPHQSLGAVNSAAAAVDDLAHG
jgi:hypothetical protein